MRHHRRYSKMPIPDIGIDGIDRVKRFLAVGEIRKGSHEPSALFGNAEKELKVLPRGQIPAIRKYLLDVLLGKLPAGKRWRGNSAALLSHMKTKAVFNAFKKILLDPDAHNYARVSCALYLGEFKTEEAGNVLLNLLKRERNPHVVGAALEGLGRTGIKKYGSFLVSQLGHLAERSRIGAIRGIGFLRYKQGVEAILDVMNDKEQSLWVFRQCASTLGEIADEKILNGDRAFAKPYEMLKSKDEQTARNGLTALILLGSKRTLVPLLITMIHPRFAKDAEFGMYRYLKRKPKELALDLGKIFTKTSMPEIKAAVCAVLLLDEAPHQISSGLVSVLGKHGIKWHPGFGIAPGVFFILDLLKKEPSLEQEFAEAIKSGVTRLKKEK